MKTAIIILAAGNSSRLGRPKQLLDFNGKTLVAHTVDAASCLESVKVAVVTGSDASEIEKELSDRNGIIIENPDWHQGMGRSISYGLQAILEIMPELDAAVFCVCDQPYVNAAVFSALLSEAATSNKGIVASSYSGTVGTPVLFRKLYFDQLLQLDGESGAKKIIEKHLTDARLIPFEKGAIDIDTAEDYENLLHDKRSGS